MERILIGVDGGGHTRKAIDYVLHFAGSMGTRLTALHVKDPYLKQFSTEIYAQGRRAYLEHVEKEIEAQSKACLGEIRMLAQERGVTLVTLSRGGDPVEEFLKEAEAGGYDLAVLGAKPLGLKNRIRSRNLPEKILRRITVPLLIVRE